MKNIKLVNNTGLDIRLVEADILAAINSGDDLPDDLADIFVLTMIEVDDRPRGILDLA